MKYKQGRDRRQMDYQGLSKGEELEEFVQFSLNIFLLKPLTSTNTRKQQIHPLQSHESNALPVEFV